MCVLVCAREQACVRACMCACERGGGWVTYTVTLELSARATSTKSRASFLEVCTIISWKYVQSCVCVCMRVQVHGCARAPMHAYHIFVPPRSSFRALCMRACVRACVCACTCMYMHTGPEDIKPDPPTSSQLRQSESSKRS